MPKLTAADVLEKVLRGTTEYRHRNNPKRQRIEHIADTWALMWISGSRYGCGYGMTYVPGGMKLILIPEGLEKDAINRLIWDSGRDKQGALTKKRIARIIEVVEGCIAIDRTSAPLIVQSILEEEFKPKPKPVPVRKAVTKRRPYPSIRMD